MKAFAVLATVALLILSGCVSSQPTDCAPVEGGIGGTGTPACAPDD